MKIGDKVIYIMNDLPQFKLTRHSDHVVKDVTPCKCVDFEWIHWGFHYAPEGMSVEYVQCEICRHIFSRGNAIYLPDYFFRKLDDKFADNIIAQLPAPDPMEFITDDLVTSINKGVESFREFMKNMQELAEKMFQKALTEKMRKDMGWPPDPIAEWHANCRCQRSIWDSKWNEQSKPIK